MIASRRCGHSTARTASSAALAVLSCLVATEAFGQAVSNGPAGRAEVELTVRGDVVSSIAVQVTGSVDLATGATTTITGSGPAGVVNFGVYNLATPLTNGEKHRVNKAPKGTYLVATLTVNVIFSGVAPGLTAPLNLQRANACGPAPDVPCGTPGNLFFAFQGKKNKGKSKALSWPKWNNYPESRYGSTVFTVPDAGTPTTTGNLDPAMSSDEYLEHQIAVWIPDSAAPGPFATTVTYTVTSP